MTLQLDGCGVRLVLVYKIDESVVFKAVSTHLETSRGLAETCELEEERVVVATETHEENLDETRRGVELRLGLCQSDANKTIDFARRSGEA